MRETREGPAKIRGVSSRESIGRENTLFHHRIPSPNPWLVAGRLVRATLLGGILVFGASAAHATVIYTYTGNTFTDFLGSPNPYTTSDYVHGYFTVATALAPSLTNADISAQVTSFVFHDFADEHLPIDSSVLPAGFFISPWVSTDAGGKLIYWGINVTNGIYTHYITTYSAPGVSQDYNLDLGDLNAQAGPIAWNSDSPGTWSIVPEPSALVLVSGGLLGLMLAGSSRRR